MTSVVSSIVASAPTPSPTKATEQFTPQQVNTLATLERVGGSISLIGIVCIFVTYGFVRRVRNVQNTFIVFASVANAGASIASIMALNGLQKGTRSDLCKTQSFLFQMFMQSDPWWSLAMAINVFLVFYYRASPDSFRRWWWVYCIICYGGPFIIALGLLLVNDPKKGPVYGQATIWCWVDPKWDSIRIYTYYMLIWICIAGSMICYFLVGYHVFHSRNQLHSFSMSKNREPGQLEQKLGMDDARNTGGFYGTVVTEVKVVHTSASVDGGSDTIVTPKTAHLAGARHGSPPPDPAEQVSTRNNKGDQSTNDRTVPRNYYSTVTVDAQERQTAPSGMARFRVATRRMASKFVVDDPIKRAYLRTSLLFAVSVFVTWIPSSLNRINGWLHGTSPYQYHLATAAVLPLQGLWNFLIFFVTSWSVVKKRIQGRGRYGTGNSQRSRDDGYGTGTVDRTMDRDRATTSHPLNHTRSNQQYSHNYRTSDSDMGDVESETLGSEVELRGLPHVPTKASTSL
ncbi:G-protein coupled receptor protein [Purpureocillium lavendulum]|uniref:G-protein coupled receptor protein n=1 Tax=Purpureocillium lavendulum TaxID=1247861 RepID=A0AB34G5S9_9HYPO|nr:G-protein coupled receptor protein [Purpureocillium lavendulum]